MWDAGRQRRQPDRPAKERRPRPQLRWVRDSTFYPARLETPSHPGRASWLREPILHFLILGALLLIASKFAPVSSERQIVVSQEQITALSKRYKGQFGIEPGPDQLDQLVRSHVREEALYREGKALGLDVDDEIVRRRIAQKTEFLLQDRSLPAAPSESELKSFYLAHTERYTAPARTSFQHLYFEAGDPARAQARAKAALQTLVLGGDPAASGADAFPDRQAYVQLSTAEVRRLFGVTPFAEAVALAKPGTWSGPYRSGYGFHLLRVDARTPERAEAFDNIRARVLEDSLQARAQAANKRAVDRLVDRYTVVRPGIPE